ncbi:MAG TPA: hypothetical protein VJ867_01220 [Gemmatimonadaceae bacterium]|nr:hypothetical protein [Gemmatimonadaceae bacterium]
MKVTSVVAAALVCAVMAACDSTAPSPSLVDDATINGDVAASSADAMVSSLDDMRDDEQFSGLTVSAQSLVAPSLIDRERTRTCYDASDAVVPNCSPLSAVRKLVIHGTFTGSRAGTRTTTGGTTVTWSGAFHRVVDDTVVRNFDGANETSRTHNDVIAAHDTTSFADGTVTRNMNEAAHDSVRAVTFDLPRSSNPFPVSGSIVRLDSVNVEATSSDRSASRQVVRRIEIDFPADAQGNVVFKINDRTCSLNLVTRKVGNCQ